MFGSNVVAIGIASLLFALYHVPYAYLSPNWPTHGDPLQALASALIQGGVAGVLLGYLYLKSKSNLVACVIAHSLINTFPGMTIIRFGG